MAYIDDQVATRQTSSNIQVATRKYRHASSDTHSISRRKSLLLWRRGRGEPEIFFFSFLRKRPRRWIFFFILVYLEHIYMESKGWAHFTMK
jgi:hypothetical protein